MNARAVSNAAILSRGALRLLTALAEPGAAARHDPTREGTLILRGARAGVSLGRGSHPQGAADELLRHDLAERDEASREIVISPTGRKHLKRAGAAERSDSFRDQHAEMVSATLSGADGPEKVTVNAAESPLDWLRRRKDQDGEPLIDPASHEAGERLRRDLTLGGVMPSVTARWDGAIGEGGGGRRDPAGATDAMIAARQRVRRALEEVGQDFADLLIDLCGFLKGLEAIERERRWPARSAKVVVRLALRRLAQHYGLETEARGPDRSRGVRTWISEEEPA